MNLRCVVSTLFAISASALFLPRSARAADVPKVVSIVAEDMSPNMSCYGETTVRAPNVDRLASEGVRLTVA